METEVIRLLVVGLIGTLGLFGPALAIGLIGFTGLSGLARNPEAKQIMPSMVVIGALAEAIGIYALLICIIVLMIM
jgi:F0F1-type ATP synthase membrane subunit c/vacuolar-type H+-ATPase subunit K